MHLFSGSFDIETHAEKAKAATKVEHASESELEQSVARLEVEVEELKEQLKPLL